MSLMLMKDIIIFHKCVSKQTSRHISGICQIKKKKNQKRSGTHARSFQGGFGKETILYKIIIIITVFFLKSKSTFL